MSALTCPCVAVWSSDAPLHVLEDSLSYLKNVPPVWMLNAYMRSTCTAVWGEIARFEVAFIPGHTVRYINPSNLTGLGGMLRLHVPIHLAWLGINVYEDCW